MNSDFSPAIQRYIEDAIAAEQSVSDRFSSFAGDGDDDDVKALFAQGAQQSQANAERLSNAVGHASESGVKAATAKALSGAPQIAEFLHIQEERTVQHLIAAHAMKMGLSAMYLSLQTAAAQAGLVGVAEGASAAMSDAQELAGKLYHLIHTRALIAYNMLTVTEIDPSVETKYREASWTGS